MTVAVESCSTTLIHLDLSDLHGHHIAFFKLCRSAMLLWLHLVRTLSRFHSLLDQSRFGRICAVIEKYQS